MRLINTVKSIKNNAIILEFIFWKVSDVERERDACENILSSYAKMFG